MGDVRLGDEPGRNAGRDAIHVAVIPATAGEALRPGQRVGIRDDKAFMDGEILGIVDPYLIDDVPAGCDFWLCLLPNSVVGMRHHWMHPAFDENGDDRSESEKWLRAYAKQMNPYDASEDDAFNRLLDGLRSGELFAYGSDLHGLYDLDYADELRFHAERYLGIKIDWGRFGFSCSC